MPAIGGFSRSQLLTMAGLRTEQRAASLDQNGEFFIALQEVCLERRWWWRRKVNVFTVQRNQAQYDLTDTTGINASDLQQIAKNGFKLFYPGSTPQGNSPGPWNSTPYSCPEPVFDVDMQDTIMATQSLYPPGTPSRFFLTPGSTITLWLDPIPDANYPAAFGYWAMPNYSADSGDETIPLMPQYMHPLLLKKLEMQFERFALGEGAEKYMAVSAEYERLKEKLMVYRQFADGYVEEFRNKSHTDAVQST